jgi:DNA repair exonuclease SbcCD ATPase subunit
VFLRQYNFNSFFELTDSNQKDFFDAIFDFSIFNTLYEYYDNIVKKMKSIENEFSQVYNWLSSEKATLEQENKRLLGLSVDEISADTEDTKIQELENRAEMCKKELTNLTSEKSKLGKTLTAQESIIKELEKSIKQFKEKEKFFPEKVDLYRASLEEGKCIVCNRKLSQTLEQKFTKILTELDSLQSDLKTMNDNLTKERDEYENINTQLYNIIDRMNSLKFNKESFELKIKNIHNTIEQNIKQKENIKKLIESRDNIISANITRINDISSVLDDDMLNNFVSYKKNLETIKDLFGKKGIKNNFIEVYVTALSEHINTILSNILDNTTVKISTEKHLSTGELTRAIDISIIKNDNVLGYFDLSGGERKRLDLAFTLALHTLLEEIGDFSSNILILDEAFDGLDAEGMERFSNYLRGYDKNSIFLITHTPYTTYADNLIVMGEDNG